ncbi:MAG: sugar transferase [Phenylobacterium sp.]|uniref:sugar transferase n=1 Tax=Phenylobacterium sp. TaxID=1871053 RepID=UPI003919DFE6
MYHIDAPEEQVKTLNGETLDRIRALFAPSGSHRREPQESVLLRLLDLAVAVAALIFFAPLMVLVGLVVWLQDGGPIFFAQRRVGFQGRTFRCLKFRTMVVDADRRLEELLRTSPEARREWEADHKLRKDPRITPLGEFLRKSSLDELPQLFNVLRGEMSVVGPRPITDAEICRYGRWFRYYRAVRPGMTGMWQVSGRNHVDYRRRVALDVLYVQRRSLGCNLMILLRTIPAVLLRSGSY